MKKIRTEIPRIALSPAEAAAAISCGPDWFAEHVQPELKVIRRGSKRLVPVAELQRWCEQNAERVL